MKRPNYFTSIMGLICLVLMSFSSIAQYGPDDDLDGDLILNSADLDDDNDGILDTDEGFHCGRVDMTQLIGLSSTTSIATTKLQMEGYPVGDSVTITLNNGTGDGVFDVRHKPSFSHRDSALGGDQDGILISGNIKSTETKTATFTFDAPIYNLRFNVADLDWGNLAGPELLTINAHLEDGSLVDVTDAITTQYKFADYYTAVPISVDTPNFPAPNNQYSGGITHPHIIWDMHFEDCILQGVVDISFIWTAPTTSDCSLTQSLYDLRYCGGPDSDGDCIPDYLDLDSDGDGCPDAVEGGADVEMSDLSGDMITGGVDGDGVPLLVAGGQSIGVSTDSTINGCNIESAPDFNASFVDMPVTGNVSTNDDVVPGTTYGAVTPDPTNPTTDQPVVNPDGTYTFTGSAPGVYEFQVEVCSPGGEIPCPTELLVITVLDSTVDDNPPVANLDRTETPMSTPVTIDVTSNDLPGNADGTLGNPMITDGPSNGFAVVDADGNLVYIPNAGFTGVDTVTYKVCDNSLDPVQCDTTIAIITVLPPGENSIIAADDYNYGNNRENILGNALDNDSDPNGDSFTATPFSTTTPAGTFTMNADGSYSFVPDQNFTGPVNFPYEICDAQGLCTNATVYLLVEDGSSTTTGIIYQNFKAVSSGCDINVNWILLESSTTDQISLERKSADEANFRLVKSFDVTRGSQNVSFEYRDTDVKSETEYLYRLRAMSSAGVSDLSQVVSCTSQCTNGDKSASVFPNPTQGNMHIELSGLYGQLVDVQIYDMLGRVVDQRQFEINSNKQQIEWELNSLTPGHYQVRIQSDASFSQNIQVIYQR